MDETLSLTADRTLIRAGGASKRYLLADVDVPLRAGDHPRLPINVALVIDRSGSMRGAKIGYACDAARYALGLLTAADRVAVVAFDDRIEVPVPSTRRDPPAFAAAREAIAHLDARGTTDLAAGWLTGCREIATHLEAGTIARCLVLTDGLANRGTTDPDVLVRHATELRARGIVTSTFGIGNDFDEVLLGA
ncbi:MAG: VWA domain-containing protein, partial [Gammaproteobacteria bacterium]